MQRRLTSDAAVQSRATQFVCLKVDVDDSQQEKAWFSRYKAPGNGIPMIFVVRSDGTLIHSQSGSPRDLVGFLDEYLTKAGRQLTDQQIKLIDKAVDEAKALMGEKRYAAALAKLEKYLHSGSFQSGPKAADALAAEITSKGKEIFSRVETDLVIPATQLDAAIEFASAVRMFSKIPEMKKLSGQALTKLRRDPELKDALRQGEMLDAATEAAGKKNGAKKAVALYQKVIEAYPDTPAAKLASERLTALDAGAAKADVTALAETSVAESGTPATKPASNNLKKAASFLKFAKALKTNNPDKAKDYAKQVLQLAPNSDLAEQASELIKELDAT